MNEVVVGTGPVTFGELVAVAREGAGVTLTADAVAAIGRAREVVEDLAAAETPAYGVSTGFGALATRHIPTRRCAPSCSARWSARTPRAPARRSSARSCAR